MAKRAWWWMTVGLGLGLEALSATNVAMAQARAAVTRPVAPLAAPKAMAASASVRSPSMSAPVPGATISDNELSMLQLQAVVGKRSTELQMTADMMSSLNGSMKTIAGNVGGGGAGKPPSGGASAPGGKPR